MKLSRCLFLVIQAHSVPSLALTQNVFPVFEVISSYEYSAGLMKNI